MSPPKAFDLDYLLNLDSEDELYNQVSEQFNEITRGFYATANFELLKNLKIKDDSKVLDLACGTGHLAIEIARRAPKGKVVGVDLSPQMIAKGREDAKKADVHHLEFIERNIHHVLPEFKEGDFNVGISCFALSYLGCEFLLKEFRRILGEKGQVGITTSSVNSLTEWQPLFMQFIMEHGEAAASFDIHEFPDMPMNADDMKARMEAAGFKKVQVKPITIPLVFRNSREAASYLISAGWLSNYFFRVKDKKVRRDFLEWALNKIDEHHQLDPHIATSIEFLAAWNEV
ncbi:MAG: methyltransferase domain-containing protein [bacterium]